jgi:hypothetical protein
VGGSDVRKNDVRCVLLRHRRGVRNSGRTVPDKSVFARRLALCWDVFARLAFVVVPEYADRLKGPMSASVEGQAATEMHRNPTGLAGVLGLALLC